VAGGGWYTFYRALRPAMLGQGALLLVLAARFSSTGSPWVRAMSPIGTFRTWGGQA